MTKAGVLTLIVASAALASGLALHWVAFTVVGFGLLLISAYGALSVMRPSGLTIERQIQPPRVPKGSPAIAFLRFANGGQTSVGVTVASQPFGDINVRT